MCMGAEAGMSQIPEPQPPAVWQGSCQREVGACDQGGEQRVGTQALVERPFELGVPAQHKGHHILKRFHQCACAVAAKATLFDTERRDAAVLLQQCGEAGSAFA